jgi:hypothetical protein
VNGSFSWGYVSPFLGWRWENYSIKPRKSQEKSEDVAREERKDVNKL